MIHMQDILKRYDNVLAVDHINLTIHKGEIFGLLGPNGAGKSTLIHMLCGLLEPNHGKIEVDGLSVKKHAIQIKQRMGVVPQELAIYENMSAQENISFFGKLYGLRGKSLKAHVKQALDFTGLAAHRKDKPKTFSGGMKRRLNIACAIVHDPDIIIMDEPTVGIDPQSRNHILESIRILNQKGSTVIYTSHYMEEVQAICHRCGIIDHGKLIAIGTIPELIAELSQSQRLMIQLEQTGYAPLEAIKELPHIKSVQLDHNQIIINTEQIQESLRLVIDSLTQHNQIIKNIELSSPNLEDVFLSLTGRNLRD